MEGRLDFGKGALRHRYLMYFMRKIDVLLMSVIDRAFIGALRWPAAFTERIGSSALAPTKRIGTGRRAILAKLPSADLVRTNGLGLASPSRDWAPRSRWFRLKEIKPSTDSSLPNSPLQPILCLCFDSIEIKCGTARPLVRDFRASRSLPSVSILQYGFR
jgi:hypothetical protein